MFAGSQNWRKLGKPVTSGGGTQDGKSSRMIKNHQNITSIDSQSLIFMGEWMGRGVEESNSIKASSSKNHQKHIAAVSRCRLGNPPDRSFNRRLPSWIVHATCPCDKEMIIEVRNTCVIKKKVHTLSPMSWFKCVRP